MKLYVFLSIGLSLGCVGCVQQATESTQSQKVIIDGSSTVEPISQAVRELYADLHPDVQVSVSRSGTGAGFEKFALGESDISDASRPIKDSEIESCTANDIEYLELTVAIDGLSVVVHPDNDWCQSLTVAQLKSIWEEGSTIKRWSDIDPSWPSDEISLWGPGDASGTYDYFIEAIIGKDGSIRSDYHPSENDNELVDGVAAERNALGFFGYAYYVESEGRVKAIAVADEGAEPVAPTPETIEDGTYSPLSRRLYIYVNRASLERPEVRDFVELYLSDEGIAQVEVVGYVSLPQDELEESRSRLQAALSGE